MKNERRIRILPENEIDNLFARPIFNDDERLVWFELSQEELLLLVSKRSLISKVDLILQLGYFKSKLQFFKFTFEEVSDDICYIMERYFSNRALDKSTLERKAKRLNQDIILKQYGFSIFDAKIHVPLLLKKAHLGTVQK